MSVIIEDFWLNGWGPPQPNATVSAVAVSTAVSSSTPVIIAPVILLSNTFEGGTNGTTISTANSAGASGSAFNTFTGAPAPTFATAGAFPGSTMGASIASGSSMGWNSTAWGTRTGKIYTRTYFKFTALTSVVNFVFTGNSGTSTVCQMQIPSYGQAIILDSLGAGQSSGSYVYQSNVWYRVEFEVVPGSGTGSMKARIYLGSATSYVEELSITSASIPVNTTGYTMLGSPMYVDNVAMGTGDWIGPVSGATYVLPSTIATEGIRNLLYFDNDTNSIITSPGTIMDFTGSIDLRICVIPTERPPVNNFDVFMAKEPSSTGRSYRFQVNTDATGSTYLALALSQDGTNANAVLSSVPVSYDPYIEYIYRVTWDQTTKVVQFFSGVSRSGPWTQIGTDQSINIASIYGTTGNKSIGAYLGASNIIKGRVRWADFCIPSNGGILLRGSFDASHLAGNATTYTDSSPAPSTWTFGTSNIVQSDNMAQVSKPGPTTVTSTLIGSPLVYTYLAARVIPDAILNSTNLTGAVTTIQDDPDSPTATWITATAAGSATAIQVSFSSPPGNLLSGLIQNFRVLLRKS